VERKVVPFDEFCYQLRLVRLFQKHPVFLMDLFRPSKKIVRDDDLMYSAIVLHSVSDLLPQLALINLY
jgi:hypothetical protein